MPTINRPRKSKNFRSFKSEKTKERQSIYQTQRWQRLRLYKLSEQPLCEICLKHGRSVEADDVHHIVSFVGVLNLQERNSIAYDIENLMSLCKQCHAAIHNGVMDVEGNYLKETR